ncbi:hypothetical protein CEXT_215731 [Caerostris extrusa]|uniref:Alpha-latrotoxin n=1 Tax=Caerostris extrusa TaxID=172846 RepID=A0AAV4VH51_CAEEX|nr:hypothetical protein CEXT_215731 [Caerostris extrusa]
MLAQVTARYKDVSGFLSPSSPPPHFSSYLEINGTNAWVELSFGCFRTLRLCQKVAGYSPLHQAATEGHEEMVKLLLKNGCHVDTQDELHGNTALHEAAWKGFSRTLEILCKNKANFYIKNYGGFTPLHLACQNGHNQCCRNLLWQPANPMSEIAMVIHHFTQLQIWSRRGTENSN